MAKFKIIDVEMDMEISQAFNSKAEAEATLARLIDSLLPHSVKHKALDLRKMGLLFPVGEIQPESLPAEARKRLLLKYDVRKV